MAEVEAGAGVLVRTTDNVEVRVVQHAAVRRGARRAMPTGFSAAEELKSALSSAGFSLAAELELVPRQPGTRAFRRGSSDPAEIEVHVGPSESALVLIEGAGGVYAWSYPREADIPSRVRRGGMRVLTFPLAGEISDPATRGTPVAGSKRSLALDWIADKLLEPVRAYVLRFAAQTAIDLAVNYIEGDKAEGLIALTAEDPANWRPGAAALPSLPQDRPAKILLMVHGTFSSTAGGFGSLTLTENGRRFLSAARRRYDAILGFDHKTLGADPRDNAALLLAELHKLHIPKGTRIDAVAHSRGGLVYRILAETLMAKEWPDIAFGTAVFVGCTNAGTHLAEPENWASLVDIYTNAIMAGVRVIAGLTGGSAVSPLISQGIKTLGRFVQALSEVAIGEMRVPGLAAMQPTSAVVKELNEATEELGQLAEYCAITSNFVARPEPAKGITNELAEFIIDRVTNRLFQRENDLVVDTESMTSFGTRNERLKPGGTFAFGSTDEVYHTIYFASDVVPLKLGEWLGLETGQLSRAGGDLSPGKASRDSPLPGDQFSLDGVATGEAPPATPRGRRRSVTAESAPAPKPLAAPAGPSPACYFAAEMEPYPVLKKQVPLFVTVSRHKIEVADNPASATSDLAVKVEPTRKIVVEIIARKNCRVVGDTSVEIDVPEEKRSETLRFTLEGSAEGAADILIEARQGARMLASFALAPIFVDADNQKLRKGQLASTTPDDANAPAVMRIYEIVDGGKTTLRFDLACLDPNIAVSESRTLPSNFSRDLYVAEIFKEIETAWLSTNRMYDQFLLRLKANGTVMANELLPDKVRDALWRHRDAIRAIQVISEEPFIPWELLYVIDPKAGLEGKGFLAEWGLVRWLHSTPWPGPSLTLRKDRVHFVIPEYLDPRLKLEGAAAERRMLADLFGSPQEVQAESMAVAEFLQKGAAQCDLLHLACHGEAAQRAVMRADLLMTGAQIDGSFAADPLSADLVKTHARFSLKGASPMVFINACQTGRAGSGISGGVAGFVDGFLRPYSEAGASALVGALWSVDDKLAYTFAKAFYTALMNGKALVDAARMAREASKNQRELTWLAYTVYGNPFARVID
jgi:hypothetical protein